MALNIKDGETVRLAGEVAELTGESKTRAVRIALEERRKRLARRAPAQEHDRLGHFLEREAWPQVPPNVLGKAMSRDEREAILGYGPEGA